MLEQRTKDMQGSVVTLKMDNMSEIVGRMGVAADPKSYTIENPRQVVAGGKAADGTSQFGMMPLMVSSPDVDMVQIPKDKVMAVAEARGDFAAAFEPQEAAPEGADQASEQST